MSARPLDQVRSVKVKLGLLVAASVAVASVVATIGSAGGVPIWLSIPVTIALALAVTQLLAVGMTSPLRQMTAAARRMATGDHSVRVAATSRDEVGELARAFNRMAEELAGVDRQRRELVANVSHELRTPLAALCALLENLADGVADPDPDTLRAALDQGERMTALVTDLLDLSRVDAGQTPLNLQDVEVGPLLEAGVAELRMSGREVTYAVQVSPPDLVVQGDPARLRQLVANLLDNASRHSPPGGIVTVRADVFGDHWHLVVADQGPGIAPANRERAFERFGTLADIDGGGGTGLGLAIARWVTDLHQGSIGFASPGPGESGARVLADLPRDPTHVRPKEIPVSESTAATAPLPPYGHQPLPSLTDTTFGDFWKDEGVPGNVQVLLGALGVGVLAGAIVPFRDHGLGVFLVLLVAGGVLLRSSRHRRDPFTLTCAALCLALSVIVMVRDAEWIVVLCLVAGAGLCVIGLVRGRSILAFLLAGVAWPLAGLRGMPWLGRTLRRVTGMGGGAALVRTAVLSVLGVTVFAVLFASADALFAEWVGAIVPDVGSADFALRVFVAVFVGGFVLAGAYLALNPPEVDRGERVVRPVAHRFEWLAPVVVVDAVFAVFLVAQAAVIFGGHGLSQAYHRADVRGVRPPGLRTADGGHRAHAAGRVGSVAQGAARDTAGPGLDPRLARRVVRPDAGRRRLGTSPDARLSGRLWLHPLRLLVDVFEGWLGVLVLATLAGGVALRAVWLPRFALFSGVALLLGLAAINPDAWIAQHNIDRYETTGKVDWTYLAGLSDDAVPVLSKLPPGLVECAVSPGGRTHDDWLEWNLGRSRARSTLAAHSADWVVGPDCPGQTDN